MESVQLLNKLFFACICAHAHHTRERESVCIRMRVLPGAHLPRSIVLNFSYLLPKLLLFFFSKSFSNNCTHTHTNTYSLTCRHKFAKPSSHKHTYTLHTQSFLLFRFACRFATHCFCPHDVLWQCEHAHNARHDTPFDAFDIAIGNKLPMLNELETCKTVKKLNWRHIACMHLAPPLPSSSYLLILHWV